MKATWRVWLLLAMDGWLLWTHRPTWAAIANEVLSARSHSAYGADHYVAVLAGAALWLAACWLALGLSAVLLGRLPGRPGAMWRAVAAAVLPSAARTLLITVTTTSMAVSTVTGAASASGPSSSSSASSRPMATSPSWPTTAPTALQPPARTGIAPQWPITTPMTTPITKPMTKPMTSPMTASPGGAESGGSTVVRPGDSLWSIAARHLGPQAGPDQIAASWPRWYEANKSTIGDDPGLLRPGTVLVNPEGAGR